MGTDVLTMFDVLDAWNLLEEGIDLGRYSIGDWKRIEEALARVPDGDPILGAVHIGITDGIAISEGNESVARLASYALAYETVWLPDPVFSFVSHEARKAFSLLPEAGGTFFDDKPGIEIHWKNLWMAKPGERRALTQTQLGPILRQMRELRSLAELGAVRFFRWEKLLFSNRDALRPVAKALADDPNVQQLTQRVPQIEYSLGARVGRFGVEAGEPFTGPGPHPKKGEPMFFVDKMPMVLSALLNASVSTRLSASFAPSAKGDRMLYDCLVSGGHVDATPTSLATDLQLPRFADAVVDDLVAIRRDSEAVTVFRHILRDAAGITEDAAIPSIEARLRESARRLREDASLWKAVGGKSVDGTVSALVTGVATYALEHAASVRDSTDTALIAAVAFLATLAAPVLSQSRERSAKRERAELIVRVADNL